MNNVQCNYVILAKQCGKKFRKTNCSSFRQFIQTTMLQIVSNKKITFRWHPEHKTTVGTFQLLEQCFVNCSRRSVSQSVSLIDVCRLRRVLLIETHKLNGTAAVSTDSLLE